MIYVDYTYKRKSDGAIKDATAQFDSINKAIRFIYSIINRNDAIYNGFSCDTIEECEEMNSKI